MKKKPFALGLAAIAAVVLACCAISLYERYRIAMIIDDEAAWDVLDSLSNATRMKVVILPDGLVTRYVSEDEDTYTVDIQDSFTVDKKGASVELWSAAEGKGVVYMKSPGMVQVLSEPDMSASVKCELIYQEGECPDTYRCLGLDDGWYEISFWEGETGFIQAHLMNWDPIDTF